MDRQPAVVQLFHSKRDKKQPLYAAEVRGGLCVARADHEEKWAVYHVASGVRVVPIEQGRVNRYNQQNMELGVALEILESLLSFGLDWASAQPRAVEKE